MPEPRVPHEAAAALGFYVYALRDPRGGDVFYVGKGVGDRVFAHEKEADDSAAVQSAKRARISEIRRSGHDVEHLLLRSGLEDEETAYIVEQAVIDGYAATGLPLTNLVRGHHSESLGLSTVEAAIASRLSRPAPPVEAPLIMFKINRAWRPDASPMEIYEATRAHWKIGADARERARYAVGVAFGVIRGVYEIESWFPSPREHEVGRWGFVGHEARELAALVGTNIRGIDLDGSQNPYRKFLDGFPGAPSGGSSQAGSDAATG